MREPSKTKATSQLERDDMMMEHLKGVARVAQENPLSSPVGRVLVGVSHDVAKTITALFGGNLEVGVGKALSEWMSHAAEWNRMREKEPPIATVVEVYSLGGKKRFFATLASSSSNRCWKPYGSVTECWPKVRRGDWWREVSSPPRQPLGGKSTDTQE